MSGPLFIYPNQWSCIPVTIFERQSVWAALTLAFYLHCHENTEVVQPLDSLTVGLLGLAAETTALAHTVGTKAQSQWLPTSYLSTNIKAYKFFYFIPGTFGLECIPSVRSRPCFSPWLCGGLMDPHVALIHLLMPYSLHDVEFGSFRMVIFS